MILWRICNYENLHGRGGLRAGGRWHTAGYPVVYLAESPVGALLEVYARTSGGESPSCLRLLRIVGPELAMEEIDETSLPRQWQSDLNVTQKLGSAWLEGGKSALLRVPSALAPETSHFLFNPLHPRAELFRVDRRYDYPIAERLSG